MSRDCVVRGVRNHIFTELKAVIGSFLIVAGAVDVAVDRERAVTAPKMVASKGINFSAGGKTG